MSETGNGRGQVINPTKTSAIIHIIRGGDYIISAEDGTCYQVQGTPPDGCAVGDSVMAALHTDYTATDVESG